MYKPRVSIITVCYNSADTIEQAILSVLEQTYENIEYIIVDGRSTDKTVDIIKKYEGHLAYWCSEEDSGIYDAMNKGIGKATGELVAFLNSDDYYYSPDSIQSLISFFEKDENADIIAGRIALINSYGIRYGYSPVPDRLEDISFRMALDHPAMLVRRGLFMQDGKFNLKYKIAADYEWVLREYCKGRKIVPVPTVAAAFRAGGASSEVSYELADEVYQIALHGNLPEMLKEYRCKIEEKYQGTKQWIGSKLMQEEKLKSHFNEIQYEIRSLAGAGDICIWGYGLRGQECHEILEKFGYCVSLIIDIDESKWQDTGRIKIMGADGLRDFCGTVIISAVNYEAQIKQQIQNMNLNGINIVCYSDILKVMSDVKMTNYNVKDDYFEYVKKNPECKIIVYGAGNETRKNLKYIGHIDCICDQRADEIREIEGIPCIPPDRLTQFQQKIIVLICIRKRDIVEQICFMLEKMPVDAEVFYFFDNKAFSYFDFAPYAYCVKPKDKLKIRLIHNDDGWILGKFARNLQEELRKLGQDADIAEEEDLEADINHYIYYGSLTKFYGNSGTVRTTMITHVNCLRLNDLVKFQAQNNVVGICMSSDTLNKLSAWGVPRDKICYVNPAQDGEIKPRKIVLGITNRCYYKRDYRKRDDLILKACGQLDPMYFKLKIMGSGWDEIVGQLRQLGFEVEYYDDFNREIYKELMPSLDYWIYSGFDEGAMGYLDALAAGVKTIVTPQGFHLDTKCGLTFPCQTIEDFTKTLIKIQEEKREITDAVKGWTWENYAKKHLEIWQYLTRTKPMEELYRHQSEYVDGIFSLLIDEISK